MAKVSDYRYHIYVDRHDGRGFELAAWYDTEKQVNKEAKFLRSRGYEVEVRVNK